MSGVRTYYATSPDTYEALKEKVLAAQKDDACLDIVAEEVGNTLQERRGESRTRHFRLVLIAIQPIPGDYRLLGQDVGAEDDTHEWVNVFIEDDKVVMTVF